MFHLRNNLHDKLVNKTKAKSCAYLFDLLFIAVLTSLHFVHQMENCKKLRFMARGKVCDCQ